MKFMRQTMYFVVSHCHFPHHSDKLAQRGHWHAQKQCGTGFWRVVVAACLFRPVSLPVDYVFAFMWGGGWTGERKYEDNKRWVIVICQTIGHRVHMEQ